MVPLPRTPVWIYTLLASIVAGFVFLWAAAPAGPSGPGEPADHVDPVVTEIPAPTTTSTAYFSEVDDPWEQGG